MRDITPNTPESNGLPEMMAPKLGRAPIETQGFSQAAYEQDLR